MMRWVKRAGFAAATVVGLLALLTATVYGVSAARFRKTFPVTDETIGVPAGAAARARGEHLVRAIAGCADCHGPDLGGRLFINAGPMVGRLYAPNLTSGPGSATSGYTAADWERAIRHGIARDGRALMVMPSNDFSHLSDADVGAIVAYLRSVPPVDRARGPTTIGPISRALYLTGQFPLLPAEEIDQRERHVARVVPAVTPEYGRYLAYAAGCIGCHGPGLSGGPIAGAPPDVPPAQNLTRAGIGSWSEQDFVHTIRTGHRPDGTVMNPFMPWPTLAQMTDAELRAIWLYLRSVPPRATGTR